MKSIILVALALAAVAVAAPPENYKTLRSEFEKNPEGSYTYGFETENGIKRQETGDLKDAVDEDNKHHTVVVVRGSFEYPGPDGKPISVTYYADETGYYAEGDSIPKPVRR